VDKFDDVTVLFADIVDFTALMSGTAPTELIVLLNNVFSRFDRLVEKHNGEKIKTVGDAYMLAGGLPVLRSDHAENVADIALGMQKEVEALSSELHKPIRVRIGINTGPVVAGVIGEKKFRYDVWGDTVNIASRMESHGVPNCIQVTQKTYDRLKGKYKFEERGTIQVKGVGNMRTYMLADKKNGH
jgi:class 3 adenylate cyclase